jgi:hypothetical protein
MGSMEMKLTLPDEVLEKLGDEPEREVLEGVLLLLVGEGKLSLERAGGILGLDGEESARWYAEHTSRQTNAETEDPDWLDEIVHFENLTSEELDNLDRFLKITPAGKGSGFSDVSINHDKYLAEATYEDSFNEK